MTFKQYQTLNEFFFIEDCKEPKETKESKDKKATVKKQAKAVKKTSSWIEFLKNKQKETGRKYNELMRDKDIKEEYKGKKLSGGALKLKIEKPGVLEKVKAKKARQSKLLKLDKLENNVFAPSPSPSPFMAQPQQQQQTPQRQQTPQQLQTPKINDPISIVEKAIQDSNLNIALNQLDIKQELKTIYQNELGNDIFIASQLNQIINVPKKCFDPFFNSLSITNGNICINSPLYTSIIFHLSAMNIKRPIYCVEPLKDVNQYLKERINNIIFVESEDSIDKSNVDLKYVNTKLLNRDGELDSVVNNVFNLILNKLPSDVHLHLLTRTKMPDTFENLIKMMDINMFSKNVGKILTNFSKSDLQEIYNILQTDKAGITTEKGKITDTGSKKVRSDNAIQFQAETFIISTLNNGKLTLKDDDESPVRAVYEILPNLDPESKDGLYSSALKRRLKFRFFFTVDDEISKDRSLLDQTSRNFIRDLKNPDKMYSINGAREYKPVEFIKTVTPNKNYQILLEFNKLVKVKDYKYIGQCNGDYQYQIIV